MKYIHQQKNWPNFTWDNTALALLLADVRLRQGRLLGRMESLGFELREESVLTTLTEDVVKSSEIEGENLDRAQVRSSIARRVGIPTAGLVASSRDVDGVVEMMLDATQYFKKPLTTKRLFGWHSALFPTGYSNLIKITVGGWRKDKNGPMQVVSGPMGRERVHYEAPIASGLGEEIAAFLKWFEKDVSIDSVIKAGVAHLWFVTIHPFDDGNGRIARALSDLLLSRAEHTTQRFYSMSSQICAERKDYYSVLESTQKGGLDITLWLKWFLKCLDHSFDRAEITLSTVLKKARYWEWFKEEPISQRQRIVLTRLLDNFEGPLTSSKWAKLAKCSQDTAARDIEDLVTRGILVKGKAGGRSTNYMLADSPKLNRRQ